MKAVDIPDSNSNSNTNTNVYTNSPAKAPNIKHNSPEVKEVVDFAERVRYMLDVKINQLRVAMRKSKTPIKNDLYMIRIQALDWVQGQIQDIILDNVTTDWLFYNDE